MHRGGFKERIEGDCVEIYVLEYENGKMRPVETIQEGTEGG
jgi:hypothetical protein